MNKIEILPIKDKFNTIVTMPGSKSFTNRALIMASLAKGESRIRGFSKSEDSKVLIKALQKVGVKIRRVTNEIIIQGNGGKFKEFKGKINLGAAGTAMRFFTSLASLIPGEIILDGSPRMRERPIKELVESLQSLGVAIEYLGKAGCPPLKIKGGKIKGGKIKMNGSASSQYFTSLLLIAPQLEHGIKIEVEGEQISKSYIDMTISSLRSFGINTENNEYKRYSIAKDQEYQATEYIIEGDVSGASYFWAIAALTGSTVRVNNIDPCSSQGDVKFPDLLHQMGCQVIKDKQGKWIEVQGPGRLKAIEVNMERMPDTAQTLAVLAGFANGRTKITGLSTLRVKETDRLEAMKKELSKMGIKVKIGKDYIIVGGGKPHGARIETYNDHRMAMAFATAGVQISGIEIANPRIVNKSFPNFWEKLRGLNIKIRP